MFLSDEECSILIGIFFFFSSRRRHTRLQGDWSSDVCSSDLAGTVLIKGPDRGRLDAAAKELGLAPVGLATAPGVKTHALRAARILLLHTWLSTQNEGWWRLTLDKLGIPYDYSSTQSIAGGPDLREHYDVI